MEHNDIHARMYAILCVAASEAIDLIDARKYTKARSLLEKALNEAEDLYIEQTDTEFFNLCPPRKLTPEEKAQLHLWRWEQDGD